MSTEVINETKEKTGYAKMYRVLAHNDPKTPMDFVWAVIMRVFKKTPQQAVEITEEAHTKGVALVVIEPFEHAEFHVDQVHSYARTAKLPLKFSYEPED
jgi:ATP-dependent Clp protease adaptor protein ClpS